VRSGVVGLHHGCWPMGRGIAPTVASRDAAGVRYLGVYRLCDHVSVASYGHNNHPSEQVETKVAQVLQANAAATHPRLSVTDRDVGTIHYETDQYAMYIAVATNAYPVRTVFKCIGELRSRFLDAMGDALHKAEPGGLTRATRPLMTELCTRYADAASIDKTLGVLRDVDEVQGIVGDSIRHMLATHENLEVLEDRADTLREQASTFHKVSRATRVVAQHKDRRLTSISCIVFLVCIAAVVTPLLIMHSDAVEAWFRSMWPPEECGSGGEDCGSGSGEGGSGGGENATTMNGTSSAEEDSGGGAWWTDLWPPWDR